MHIHIQPCEILMPRLQMCDTETRWLIWNMQQGRSRWKARRRAATLSVSFLRVGFQSRTLSGTRFFQGKKTQKKNKNGFNVRKHLESGGSSPAEALIKLCHRQSNVKSGNALWASITFSFMHFNPHKREKIWIIDSWGLIFLCYSSRRIYEIYGSLNLICGEWRRLQAHTHAQMQCMCVCLSSSLKVNAEIGDIAVGGGQTNFEHWLQSYYGSSLEVRAEAPQTREKKEIRPPTYAEFTEHVMSSHLFPRPQEIYIQKRETPTSV